MSENSGSDNIYQHYSTVHLSQNKITIGIYITLQCHQHDGFIILSCTLTTFRLHGSGLAVIIQ